MQFKMLQACPVNVLLYYEQFYIAQLDPICNILFPHKGWPKKLHAVPRIYTLLS
jgi:hypothetical protein